MDLTILKNALATLLFENLELASQVATLTSERDTLKSHLELAKSKAQQAAQRPSDAKEGSNSTGVASPTDCQSSGF